MAMPASPRIAVVTGTSRGLGRAIMSQLLDRDYHVIGAQRSIPDQFNNATNLRLLALDLDSYQSIHTFTELLLTQLPYLDILVNNAAICPSYPSHPSHVEQHWRSVMHVNFFAHVHLTERLLPLLQRSSKPSRVVNISSGDGELLYFEPQLRIRLTDFSHANCIKHLVEQIEVLLDEIIHLAHERKVEASIFNGQPAYKLSKAAMNVYTQVAANAYNRDAPGEAIRFVSVCPGDVDTAMADEAVYTISPTDAVQRMWPLLDVDIPCPNAVFLRGNELIPW